jgi:hypothetical protein
MRILILSLVLGIALAGQGNQIVVFAGGNSAAAGGGNSIPFNPGSIYTEIRYQTYVPPALLPGVQGLLTEIAHAPSSSATLTLGTVVLSVGHAPVAPTCNLAGNSPDLMVMFNGSVTWSYTADQWSPMPMPVAFSYNGVDGLLIEVRHINGSGGSAFRSADTGSGVQRVYNRYAGGFSATTCSHNPSIGLRTRLTFWEPTITPGGTPTQGQVLPLVFDQPPDAGLLYLAVASLGVGPTPFLPPDQRSVGVSFDDVFFLSMTTPAIFQSFSGVLDSSGSATAGFFLPFGTPSGIVVNIAFVTGDPAFPSGVRSIAPTFSFATP